MTTTITDQYTIRCPCVVRLVVTAMGWTLRKVIKHQRDKQFNIVQKGIFLLVGIQNPQFTVGKQSWRFETLYACPENQQPGMNRHAVTLIDGVFFHYDIHDGKLHRYSLKYLVGERQEEHKYLVRVQKFMKFVLNFRRNGNTENGMFNMSLLILVVFAWVGSDVILHGKMIVVATTTHVSNVEGSGKTPKTTILNL